jgi:hypothetical protein
VTNHEEFRRYAEECRRLIEDGDIGAHRTTLEDMAQTWRKLAVEEERIADLVREVDTLFSTNSDATSLAARRAWESKPAARSH